MSEFQKVTRVEVIDSSGRILVKYGEFDLSFQDNDRTLKVFVKGYRCSTRGCDKLAEDGVEYCPDHSPYFSGVEKEEKKPEKIGSVRI